MQTASAILANYDSVRARLWGRQPFTAPAPVKAKRPPIIYPPRLRRYDAPIGPVIPFMPERIPAKAIVKAVATVTRVTAEEMAGPSRMAHVCRARFLACYLIKRHTDHSLNMIAKALGRDFDHTTILSAIRRGADIVNSSDGRGRAQVQAIMSAISTGPEAFLFTAELSTVDFPHWLPVDQHAAYAAMVVERGKSKAYKFFEWRFTEARSRRRNRRGRS